MILEAQQILNAMIEAGFDLKEIHPELKRPKKAAAIHATLSENGEKIENLEIISTEQSQQFWTHGNGNHNRFPVDKIDPIQGHSRTTEEIKQWNKLKGQEKTDHLKTWVSESFPTELVDPFSEGQIEALKSRSLALASLAGTPASRFIDLLALVCDSDPSQRIAWARSIFESLKDLALHGAADELNEAQQILATLMFKPKPASVPVIWDLPGQGLSGTNASSPENFAYVNQALLDTLDLPHENENTSDTLRLVCALTNSPEGIEKSKFPDPTLPQIGKTFLFSRNKDNPSFGRYRTKSVETFPVSQAHLRRLDAALVTMTDRQREGKTWTSVASEQPKKADLLLIFSPANADLPFAEGIGADQSKVNQFQFEDLARRLAERVKGQASDQLRGSLMIAVIRSVDKGNRKVIFRRNLDVAGLDRAAQSWSAACKGLRGRRYYVPVGKGKEAPLLGPCILNPGEIPRLTKQIYLSDATAQGDSAGGLTFSESFDLLLGIDNRDPVLASRALRITQQRLGNVLSRFAGLQYRTPSEVARQKPELRWTCLKAQSLFAVILYALQRNPQQIMNSLAFQLGQFSAALDVIHAAYCYCERGGDLPPKLIGNACFQAATRNPVGAISQASQRIGPHLAWLRRFGGESANRVLAKMPEKSDSRSTTLYALKLRGTIRQIAANMSSLQSPEMDDRELFRAELLLGYLAGPPSTNDEEPNAKLNNEYS